VPVDEEGLLVGASEQLPHEGGRQLQQRTVRQRLPHTIITPHYKCELYWRAQNRIGITEKQSKNATFSWGEQFSRETVCPMTFARTDTTWQPWWNEKRKSIPKNIKFTELSSKRINHIFS
jgi:hypothetical protein